MHNEFTSVGHNRLGLIGKCGFKQLYVHDQLENAQIQNNTRHEHIEAT